MKELGVKRDEGDMMKGDRGVKEMEGEDGMKGKGKMMVMEGGLWKG